MEIVEFILNRGGAETRRGKKELKEFNQFTAATSHLISILTQLSSLHVPLCVSAPPRFKMSSPSSLRALRAFMGQLLNEP